MGLLDPNLFTNPALLNQLKGLLGNMPISKLIKGEESVTKEGLLGAMRAMPVFDPSASEEFMGNAMNAITPMGAGFGMIKAMKKPTYGIAHRPMNDAGGAARLHDLTPAFGEDIYGRNALQYFGSGDAREASVVAALKRLRGNPDAEVTVYRGIPSGVKGEISKGDWVTLDPKVAADYGEQVLAIKAKAKDITSWPDSLLEFGYYPD